MKKHLQHIIFCCLGLLMLVSCNNFQHNAERFSRQLNEQASEALKMTEELTHALQSQNIDSIREATQHANILFYVYDKYGLLYWSDNWLAADHIMLNHFDTWELFRLKNAIVAGRWTHYGQYNILTIIPIKYAYPFENQQLQNVFCEPFTLDKTVDIQRARDKRGVPISIGEQYIFSLYEGEANAATPMHNEPLKDSFSYGSVLSNNHQHDPTVHYFFIISIVFVGLLVLFSLLGILRHGGVRKMPLGVRFQYLIVAILLTIFTFVVITSIWFVSKRSEDQQVEKLEHLSKYIQISLKDIYEYKMQLSEYDTETLNSILRDICFTYETDINVYNMHGDLVGTSSPDIFEQGIISKHMATRPFFAPDNNRAMILHEHIAEMNYMAAYVPFLNIGNVPIGYIQIPFYESEDAKHIALDNYLAIIFPPFVVLMLLSVLFGMLSSRRLTKPLTSFTMSLRAFRVEKKNAHLNYNRQDEVGELAQAYNQLIDELQESTAKLARTEREVAWRTMARQIAHEINNPLTPMKLQIQQLQRLKQNEDERFDSFFNRSTTALIEQIDNLSRIASSFSSFAKMPEVQTSQVDIASQLFSVITLFRTNAEHVPVRYVGAEYGVYAQTDGEQIRQVFTNIIKNAMQAIGDRADSDIIVLLKDMNTTVEISISDNGPGIPADIQDKIFMPNFTTKSTGTGLGLAISKNIIEGSGGSIRFETSPKGTTFYITLRK